MSAPPITFPNDLDTPKPVPGSFGLAGAAIPDITRFLQVRSAVAPALAPDGSRVAFRTSTTGTPQLWVVNASGGALEQLTFGEPVTFSAWSPSGEWLIYGCDRGGNEREGFYLVRPDGKEERELLAPSDAFREFGAFSLDGGRIAYATTERNGVDFDIRVLDLRTGRDQVVWQGEGGLYVASFRPDGGALLLRRTRGEDANDVLCLDLETRRAQTWFAPEVAARYTSFTWRRDAQGFYLVSDHDRDLGALAYCDAATHALRWIETGEHDVEQVRLTRDQRYLVWTWNAGGYSGIAARDLELDERVAPPALPRGVYHIDVAAHAPVIAVQVNGPQLPGDVFTWDLARSSLVRATRSASAGIDLEQMVVPEAITFAAQDGETIHGLLYLPRGERATRPPIVLSLHGGPSAQARPLFQAVHQFLLARGIAILDLNFRGSTGYGKRYARLDNGRLRKDGVRDMADAVAFLARDGRADATRVAAMGGSYGGFMTLAALTTFADRFRGGVAMVAVSNWITALEGASPQLKASDKLEYGDIDDPGDREFFRDLSPLTHVHEIRAPLLIVHGANDPRDPVTEADQIVRAIRMQRGEVEYLRFPDEGHGIRKLANRIIAHRRIAAFLERILT